MGRRKGFGGGRKSYSTGAKFRSSPLFNKKSKPAKDEKDEKAPPPAKVVTLPVESRRESFFSSIADGFHWGAGNAMGHRFVEAIFGPRTIKTEVVLQRKLK
ncbi:uncharacterized protein LOC106364003 isoform X2 [Brassica napus]|uniref:uncharacterized protein LOC106364003 isoform X2 n=1 Tax=Brassica napus TaxID=3708 RepID=UPI00207878AE|nr:uncharacterized protein LOC106364003 isoform X2 [Brassica napus]